MKKLYCLLLASVLIWALPANIYAGTQSGSRIISEETIDLGDGYTVTYTISADSASTRATTGFRSKTATYRDNGNIIATVTLHANFSYDGTSATATNAYVTHTTYDSWNYTTEDLSRNGATASVKGKLSKTLHGSVAVNFSLTCSPSGTIS